MSLISYLTRIHFADRVLEDALPEEMRRHGLRRPLVILDDDLDPDDGLERLEDALPPGCKATIRAATGLTPVGQESASLDADAFDSILGLGGTVAIHAARALARLWCRPVLAIPATPGAIGVEPGDGSSQLALPVAVLCDPTFTRGLCKPCRAAETGMEALSHCIEAYLANSDNPPADGMALDGVRRAARHLSRWVRDRDDAEARREMMAVGLNGALAAQKGLGAVEALARALDGTAIARRGRYHAALLPPVLAFNEPAIAPQRLADLAAAMASGGPAALPEAVAALGAALGLATRLAAPLPGGAQAEAVAAAAAADPASRSNPRHLTVADYARLLARAQQR
jgi:alcohol dehydrogenase class IV